MRALWRRCGKVVLLGVALLVSEGRAPALGAEEYPPLPGPFEPMEPRQAERSGFAPLGLYLGGVVLHADGGIERRARLESFDSAPEVASESWLTTIWLDTEATFGDDRWVMETAAGVEAERDSRVPAPETLSGYAKAGLRMPLGQEGVVKTDLSWTQAHEARTTPLAEGFAATPTRLRTTTAGMEMLWRPGRLALDLRLEARREDYADVPRLGYDDTWDFIINNDDRDRDHMIAAARASWRFGPLSSVYVRGTASRIDYREGRDDFGFDRDSTGGAVFAGLTLGRPRLWRAFLEVGRVSRSMDSPVLPSVDVMAVNGGITWATTPLMTNQLRLHTAVAETTEPLRQPWWCGA